MYGGEIFKLTEHTERLFKSAEILDFSIPFTVDQIDEACKATCAINNLDDCYVRPIAWRGSEQMGVSAQQTKIHVAIAAWEWPSYFKPEEKAKGIRLTWAKYKRPSPETAPTASKAAGLYMICTISKHAAEREGFSDAMMLDWRGYVAEATGANVFFVRDGVIHTPIPDCFLDGITRQSVMELARKQGLRDRRAAHQAGGAVRLLRVLHHRHRRRGDAGGADRRIQLHARQHLAVADGRLRQDGAPRAGNSLSPLGDAATASDPPRARRSRRGLDGRGVAFRSARRVAARVSKGPAAARSASSFGRAALAL